jgi:hypothetical protein
MNFKSILIALFCAFFVSACGGGGDSVSNATIDSANAENNATIDSANAEKLGIAATEGVKVVLVGNISSALGFRSNSIDQILTLSESIAARIGAKEIIGLCIGGGSAVDNTDVNGNGSIILTDCDFGGVVATGTVTISVVESSTSTSFTLSFDDFTLTVGSDVSTFNFSTDCTLSESTFSCSYSSTVTGFDSRSYTISGATVTGNSSTGFTVGATVIDPDHGRITISTFTPITFNYCSNGQPDSGEVRFTDDSAVLVSIIYYGCDTFTVSYSGTSTIYNW